MNYTPSPRFEACLKPIWNFDGFKDDRAQGENFATKYGVTEFTYSDAYNRGIVDCSFEDMTENDCKRILDVMFFRACSCDKMTPGIDLIVFNDAVLTGVRNAGKLVQRVVGTYQDGLIGPATLTAIASYNPIDFANRIMQADDQYYASLANAKTYINGWTRRETFINQIALQMITDWQNQSH